jgi:predicted ester cyclase
MNDLGELITFATRYAEAWCSQNPESVAVFFAENGSLRVNDGPPAVGRAAIAEIARGFMHDFPDMTVTMDKLEPESPDVGRSSNASPARTDAVFHWTLTGTNTGPGGTGKRVRISGYELWKIDNDGLIVESKGHFDSADYERQLNGK